MLETWTRRTRMTMGAIGVAASMGCGVQRHKGDPFEIDALADAGPSRTAEADGGSRARDSAIAVLPARDAGPYVPPSGSVAAARAACDAVEQGFAVLPSEAAFRARLVGAWVRCGSTSAFADTLEDGLEFLADGTWRRMDQVGDQLVPAGSGASTFELVDTTDWNGPGFYQLNLAVSGGTLITHPAFVDRPDKVRLNFGVSNGDYVRVGAQPVEDPARVELDLAYPAAACAGAQSVQREHTHPSRDEALAEAVGVWTYCSGSLGQVGDVGIEIAPDGTWYLLFPVRPGIVVRGQGFEREGTWTLGSSSQPDGRQTYQLNLKIAGSGWWYVPLLSSSAPRTLDVYSRALLAIDP